jgi:formylglycine-generating enzyme
MAGNVWQWYSDSYRSDYFDQLAAQGKVARNPEGPENSFDPAEPGVSKRLRRGGSFLCTDQYCTTWQERAARASPAPLPIMLASGV